MGHHFDSPESRADSRINITDVFVFEAPRADRITAVLCVSPLAGLPSPYHAGTQWRTFRPGCAYDLRFDTDGDLRPDLVVRFVFSGDDAPQRWTVSLLTGEAARDHHAAGRSVGSGACETTQEIAELGRVWAGEAGDPFWLDATAAKSFIDTLKATRDFAPQTFSNGVPTTGATNVLAIVAEIPRALLGPGSCNVYATVSADDHGHWTQVQRCGRPNFAATFVDDPQLSLRYNGSDPADDRALFGAVVAAEVARIVAAAGTHPDPAGYGALAARALLPDVIPFDPSFAAAFGFAGINGRTLRDDFGAVVYSTVFNFPMRTALAPLADVRDTWPYVPAARPLSAGAVPAVPPRNETASP